MLSKIYKAIKKVMNNLLKNDRITDGIKRGDIEMNLYLS